MSNPIGEVPMVVLAPLPSARWPLVGRSILGDGSLIRALYNRQSEEDDVLRNQAFSIFVVSMPSDVEDVEKVKSEMGNETGTTRALFVRGTGSYETPDMGVPAQIRENEAYLIRELYRLAHVPYDNDARDAESAEAKRADWEEITGILRGVAAEMHRAELALARLWCAWQTATPEAAEKLFESANVTVTYPRDYFEENPTDNMALHMEALKLEIGPTWDAVVKKDAVRWLKPTLDQPTLHKELDALARTGAVDVLVNSASNYLHTPFDALDQAAWDVSLDVNLKAPYLLSVALGRAMRARGRGAIVNVVDWAAARPYRGYLPYCVSKAGLVCLTKGLARELAPNVRVNAVAPGPVLLPEDMGPTEVAAAVAATPLGRVGRPEDVAACVGFLVAEAQFTTGSVVHVDGGRAIAWRGDGATVSLDDGIVSIDWRVLAPRRIALITLPRLHVRFEANGFDAGTWQGFMRYFDLYTQRGGG